MRLQSAPDAITSNRLLLVEGNSDRHFFEALVKRHGRDGVDIEAVGGKSEFERALRQLPRRRGFRDLRWLGVVCDADYFANSAGADVAFGALCRSLGAAQLPVPIAAWTETSGERLPRVTVFILPPNSDEGDLESWVLQSHLSTTHQACAEQLVACLGREAPRQRSKLVLTVYLASIDPEKVQLCDAVQREGAVSLDSEVFRPFLNFIPRDDEAL